MIFRKLYLQQSCKYEADETIFLKNLLKSDLKATDSL